MGVLLRHAKLRLASVCQERNCEGVWQNILWTQGQAYSDPVVPCGIRFSVRGERMLYDARRALELLRLGTGLPSARFRDGQEEAIRHVVEGRARLLVVQRTGWGKSFVYFIAAKLLREAREGPTLLVSPLLSLMRNQIAAAHRMGLRAETINCENNSSATKAPHPVHHHLVSSWEGPPVMGRGRFGTCPYPSSMPARRARWRTGS